MRVRLQAPSVLPRVHLGFRSPAMAAAIVLALIGTLPGIGAAAVPATQQSLARLVSALAPANPSLRFTSPESRVVAAPGTATLTIHGPGGDFTVPYIQTSPDLKYSLNVSAPPARWIVVVTLDAGKPGQVRQLLLETPWQGTFNGIGFGEHTLDARLYAVPKGVTAEIAMAGQPAATSHLGGIARGDIVAAMGDSITEGLSGGPFAPGEFERLQAFPDWIAAEKALRPLDPAAVSPDGRNFPQPGAMTHPQSHPGFEVRLGTLLAQQRHHPVLVINLGWSGSTSAAYTGVVQSGYFHDLVASAQPNAWLLNIGANDPKDHRNATDYQGQMQGLLSSLLASGAAAADVHLACPSFGKDQARLDVMPSYMPVIEGFRSSLGLGPAPNFYAYYRDHQDQVQDSIHPNAAGYAAMAQQWADALAGNGSACA